MTLKQCIMTNSTCYKDQLLQTVNNKPNEDYWEFNKTKIGIVVHSTGVNNPYLKRYVQPLETDSNYNEIIADIGKNTNKNDWNHSTRYAGVHAFTGLNAKDEIETYETLPYEWAAWGVGPGSKGSYNTSPTAHIQFEICEGNLYDEAYFYAVMKESQEYCAYLCKKFGWTSQDICCHAEAYERGYGIDHEDIKHWLKIYNKTMDWYRDKVGKLLDEKTEKEISYIEYTVKKGDTLSKIAKENNTTVAELCEINNITNANSIKVNQILLIPASTVLDAIPSCTFAVILCLFVLFANKCLLLAFVLFTFPVAV